MSNILNAQNPNDIGIRSASQIQEDKDDPLEYGYVNDKDILVNNCLGNYRFRPEGKLSSYCTPSTQMLLEKNVGQCCGG